MTKIKTMKHWAVKEQIVYLTRRELATWLSLSIDTIDSMIKDGFFVGDTKGSGKSIRIRRDRAIACIMAFRHPGILG